MAPDGPTRCAVLGYLLARSGDANAAQEQHQLLEERERVEPATSLDVDFTSLRSLLIPSAS